jgi:hypothetical protein
MHSIAIVSVLAAAGLVAAGPAAMRPRSAFYVCANNGFRGDCSVDPCALPWCPDFEQGTYTPVEHHWSDDGSANPAPAPVPAPIPAPAPGAYSDPTVCPVGTGYFQACANGFRGCCKTDACGGSWCPDFKAGSYTPANTWEVRSWSDPTVCAAGTGYFQSCAKNGFRGCCKSDACGAAWCPDYKFGTYEPASWSHQDSETNQPPATTPPTTTPVPKPAGSWSDPTVCAPGTGYYQVCANGFKGCAAYDACSY